MLWHEIFPTHKHGCWKWGTSLKISAKRLFSWFRVVKTNFIIVGLPTLQKLLEKSTSAPPWKKYFRCPCTQTCKVVPFLQKVCCIRQYYTIWQHCNNTQSRISRTPYPQLGGPRCHRGPKISVPSPLITPEKASIPQIEIWSTRNQWS